MPHLPPAVRAWTAHQWAVVGVAAATGFVAVTAFVLAYGGSFAAALDAGTSRSAARWYPVCIEGATVVMSLATVLLPKGKRRVAWFWLLVFASLSAGANVLHAWEHQRSLPVAAQSWWALGFAAVPPLALPVCVRVLERVVSAVLSGVQPDDAEPAPGTPAEPSVDQLVDAPALTLVESIEPVQPVVQDARVDKPASRPRRVSTARVQHRRSTTARTSARSVPAHIAAIMDSDGVSRSRAYQIHKQRTEDGA